MTHKIKKQKHDAGKQMDEKFNGNYPGLRRKEILWKNKSKNFREKSFPFHELSFEFSCKTHFNPQKNYHSNEISPAKTFFFSHLDHCTLSLRPNFIKLSFVMLFLWFYVLSPLFFITSYRLSFITDSFFFL